MPPAPTDTESLERRSTADPAVSDGGENSMSVVLQACIYLNVFYIDRFLSGFLPIFTKQNNIGLYMFC